MREFNSTYRVVALADRGRRVNLYDIGRDDNFWVNAMGYDKGSDVYQTLQRTETGNVIEATITDQYEKNEYWDFQELDIQDRTFLFFIPTEDFTVSPADDLWEKKDSESDLYTAARWNEDNTDILYEVQLQDQVMEEKEAGEMVEYDVFPALMNAELLTEPQFYGIGCNHLEDGARAILVVRPEDREYIVFYLFPEKGEMFREIWGGYYDYLQKVGGDATIETEPYA